MLVVVRTNWHTFPPFRLPMPAIANCTQRSSFSHFNLRNRMQIEFSIEFVASSGVLCLSQRISWMFGCNLFLLSEHFVVSSSKLNRMQNYYYNFQFECPLCWCCYSHSQYVASYRSTSNPFIVLRDVRHALRTQSALLVPKKQPLIALAFMHLSQGFPSNPTEK